jgi:hypothetical protein
MKSNRELAESWRKHMQAFESSGLTRNGYCQRNGINVYQLDYWRRRIKKSNPPGLASENGWIPLRVRDDQASEKGSGVCLRIGRLAIEVKPGIDRELLTDILRTIGPIC